MNWSKKSNLLGEQKERISSDIPSQNIGKSMIENEQILKHIFQNCSDIQFHEMVIQGSTKLLFIYVDGMINADLIMTNVLRPLMYDGLPQGLGTLESISQICEKNLISILQTKKVSDIGDITEHILKGNIAILADGDDVALLGDVSKFETRSVQESSGEITLRGSRESFTEHLRTNTSLLRRILATPKLKMESLQLGTLTKTEIVVVYLEGIVSMSVLNEVRYRLSQIQIDGILESGYIEESIEETHYSPFSQLGNTERPDVVAAGLLEGKLAIITDGSPFALVAPITFWGGLQAPDDYYERFLFVNFSRWIRYIFIFFSVVSPSIYIALTNFHPEMVPPKLMITIAALREMSPFPSVIEVFLMELMFEGLREAGIRLPQQIGPLVTVAGALVIGEAAVRAGIISAPIVIVVSAAGIASFVIPRYRAGFPLRILRFPLLILSGAFGLLGLAIGIIAIITHLIHLSPFGTPYLEPVTPLIPRRLKDVLMRQPHKLSIQNKPDNGADHP
ncbi:spore germination protein [Paenibacillus sp. GCM10023248]|uniref:spore germination protein n=1 Tax=Bacillales TaxID=1385 RepID=UPI002378B40C|nr:MULTISPECIES: spore germination protein [Bacillales]MDD9267064.1 spore germination protein [Paenibacillus sp. MAHUQ-63]MDR6881267.1 spore germination protein KA [Bacillus sp. 3255]